VARLAVEGVQLIKIGIGNGIALVGGQAILRRVAVATFMVRLFVDKCPLPER